jgi:SpoVK/Ycf46/Vps4 family AAA+-type ATPase
MDIEKYFRASIPLVAVDNPVPEEQSAIEQIAGIGKTLKSPVYFWDLERGLQQISLGNAGVVYSTIDSVKLKNPEPMLQHIRNSKEAGIFILADLDIYFADSTPFTSPAVIRGLKNLCFELKQSNKRVVLLGSNIKLPNALDGLIPIVTNPLPNQQEVEEWLGMILAGVGEARMEGGKRIPVTLTNEDKAKLTRASLGLTREEIHDAVRLCAVTNKTLDRTTPDFVKDVKILKLRKLSIELSEPPTVAIGGQQVIRKWLEQRRVLFDDKVRQRHNLPYPKGVLLVGAPGTGKSLQAKSIGQVLGIPIMRFDIGSIFAGIVGESESNLRTTFKLAEAISPVVLWIDEVEKAFAGASSESTDSGVSQRLFGAFLSWMQEKTAPVFVVATANDVSRLPKEFLRKGRFDDIFYVDLPKLGERGEIFKIHLAKHNCTLGEAEIQQLASQSEGYSGAEIEQAVNEALVATLVPVERPLELADLELAIRDIVPLTVLRAEEMSALQQWAAQNARSASGEEKEVLNHSRTPSIRL